MKNKPTLVIGKLVGNIWRQRAISHCKAPSYRTAAINAMSAVMILLGADYEVSAEKLPGAAELPH